ncbi:ATP12 family chaperone protein [Roseovarius atlanticus]|uniref:ATP12 family chaperone protein n=1 Tax=Roseovarius atlanticus TaxID=1641875 RepID=UPI001C961488|nr:ATP12 family protein [Roseovarius atlanticus]MBY5987424.1 ATPase [Roseovarius atlanticus]MBY6126064.1 ATPase [Roseovarius atlanticus]MBY6149476.1 ATPase [Roseovarius atlanticus]
MSEWKAKRFWKEAAVVEDEGGYGIRLDGRAVRTPAKAAMIVPTRALAEAVAAEWDAQEDLILPGTMPVTRSANAAIDKVRHQHAEVADMLAGYADTDLLCYRADSPDSLIRRQAEAWDPLLDWAEARYGARLVPVAGVMHRPQEAGALAQFSAQVHAMDNFTLTAFHDLVGLSGSLVIGLAALEEARPAEDLWELSRLDERWQEDQWGIDEEARAVEAVKRAEFLHAKRFSALSATPE